MSTKRNTTQAPDTIARSLDALSVDELNSLAARVANEIAARHAAPETIGSETTPAPKARKSTKRKRGTWEEVKIISGHAYRYRRFWQGGRLRSKYLGKV